MADNSKRNPNNAEHALYKSLTKLFSGPITSYKTQAQLRYKRRELDKQASRFVSTSGQSFKRKLSNPYDSMNLNYIANQNRAERYVDFNQMEFMAELAAALTIYADEMTVKNRQGKMLNIHSKNEEIRTVLESLFYKTLNIEFNAHTWARTMCKYGDLFLFLDIDETIGIKNVICLPTEEVERMEGKDKTNPNYVVYQWNSAGMTFENWQIAHFRILGQDKYSPYGTSVLDSARRAFRQLELLENAVISYRVTRSAEKRVFYLDVGNIQPEDVEQHVQKVITGMKRNQIVDPASGRVDLRYSAFGIEDDIYIPVRGGTQNTKIETLPGGKYVGDVEDVKMFRDKLFSALLIPPSYLTAALEGSEDKTSLAQKDIRFARTIDRLQRIFISELEKIAITHLFVLGFRNEDLLNFKLSLNSPSKLADLQDLELFKSQADAAITAEDAGFSKRWIAENIYKMSPEEFLRIQREKFYDKAMKDQLEAEAGEMGGGLGGGLGDMAEMEDSPEEIPDLGGATEGESSSGGEEEKDNGLLMAPAKRDDSAYTTPGANGKMYIPEKTDKRGTGARTRHYKSLWSDETSSSTMRNLFKGADGLKRIGKGIMSEDSSANDEKLVLEVQNKLNSLSKKFNKSDKRDGDE